MFGWDGVLFFFFGGGLQYFPPNNNKNNGHEKQSPNRSKTFYIADEKDTSERETTFVYFLITRLHKIFDRGMTISRISIFVEERTLQINDCAKIF